MKNKISFVIAKLFLLTVLAMIFSSAYSQRPNDQRPQRIPDSTQIVKMTNNLAQELFLTDEQKAKITDLYLAHFKEVKKQLDEIERDKKRNREKMETYKSEFEEKIKSLLIDEQKVKFDNFQKTHRPQQRQEHREMN
ncbi:MAG: hypothetical protein A2X00_04315 [Bacteroidetes bacterium GWE2_32_14]|nr:MAG: hypothetical protein A2X00_04315 [Bacteroidetes bacterium GWE2_32_14]